MYFPSLRSLFAVASLAVACSSSEDGAGGAQGTLAEGAECTSDAQCAKPADGRSVRCQCVDGKKSQVCTAQLANGAPCPVGSSFSIGCSGEARCVNATCQVPAALGESCASNLCKDGLSCQSGKCAPGRELGESCNFVFDDCVLPNHCPFSSKKCTPPAKIGEPCDSSARERACEPGAACDTGTGKCAALLDNGAACTRDTLCKSGNCDFASSGSGFVCADKSAPTNVTCGFP